MAQKEKWNQKLFRIVKEEGMRTAVIYHIQVDIE